MQNEWFHHEILPFSERLTTHENSYMEWGSRNRLIRFKFDLITFHIKLLPWYNFHHKTRAIVFRHIKVHIPWKSLYTMISKIIDLRDPNNVKLISLSIYPLWSNFRQELLKSRPFYHIKIQHSLERLYERTLEKLSQSNQIFYINLKCGHMITQRRNFESLIFLPSNDSSK